MGEEIHQLCRKFSMIWQIRDTDRKKRTCKMSGAIPSLPTCLHVVHSTTVPFYMISHLFVIRACSRKVIRSATLYHYEWNLDLLYKYKWLSAHHDSFGILFGRSLIKMTLRMEMRRVKRPHNLKLMYPVWKRSCFPWVSDCDIWTNSWLAELHFTFKCLLSLL
jgi:hypothetical protein